MKRALCFLFAAALLLALGCGKKISSSAGVQGGSVVPSTAPQTADGKNYDNSVRFENGELVGSAMEWDYFYNKSAANKGGEVKIVVVENGNETVYELSYAKGTFTLKQGESVSFYNHIAAFEAALPAGGEHSGVSLGILTDEAGLTAESFFGGAVPENVGVGYENAKGIVVFAKFN